MKQVSYNELTELTGITYRTIKDKFARAGIKPVDKVGRKHLYDSVVALRCLYGGGLGEVIEDEDTNFSQLLERERWREKKRQNDVEEQLLAPVSLITTALEKSGSIIIAVLETLPLSLKRKWPEITGDQIQLVKQGVAECRNAIADMEIEIDE